MHLGVVRVIRKKDGEEGCRAAFAGEWGEPAAVA